MKTNTYIKLIKNTITEVLSDSLVLFVPVSEHYEDKSLSIPFSLEENGDKTVKYRLGNDKYGAYILRESSYWGDMPEYSSFFGLFLDREYLSFHNEDCHVRAKAYISQFLEWEYQKIDFDILKLISSKDEQRMGVTYNFSLREWEFVNLPEDYYDDYKEKYPEISTIYSFQHAAKGSKKEGDYNELKRQIKEKHDSNIFGIYRELLSDEFIRRYAGGIKLPTVFTTRGEYIFQNEGVETHERIIDKNKTTINTLEEFYALPKVLQHGLANCVRKQKNTMVTCHINNNNLIHGY